MITAMKNWLLDHTVYVVTRWYWRHRRTYVHHVGCDCPSPYKPCWLKESNSRRNR